MQRLPTTIGSLKKLQVLDLEENKLEFLPPEIGMASALCSPHIVTMPAHRHDAHASSQCWRIVTMIWVCHSGGPPFRRSAIPGYYCYNNPNPNPILTLTLTYP